MNAEASSATVAQFATFKVDNLFFGVDVLKVQEVLRDQTFTSIPLAPAVVRGLINLRGQIVPAIDMRRRLNLGEAGTQVEPVHVVIRTEESAVSLLVDEIGDVLQVSSDSFEQPPENLTGGLKTILTGVHKLEQGLLLALNIEQLLQISLSV